MPLSNPELEIITRDFLLADGKSAQNIYYETSYLMELLINQKKGIFERPNGGVNIKVPLKYDGAEGGFYSRNSTLSESDRQNITAVFFGWKHAFGNATIYRTDELENAGEYAEVALVTEKVTDAMETCRDQIAKNLYNAAGDDSLLITGLRSLTSESADVDYGGKSENDIVAEDGTKPWEGKTTTTTEAISLDVIRTLRSGAKIKGGKGGKPNLGVTTETLFNKINGILQVQQRFTAAEEIAKAGFTGVNFEGMDLVVDDYCPSGYLFVLNTNHVGFAIHQQGFFARTPWHNLVSGAQGRTMKILWDGNMVCNNRKAHAAHSNLS